MRTFDRFPEHSICPICGTNKDKQSILVPILRSNKGNLYESTPTHLECLVDRAVHDKQFEIIYAIPVKRMHPAMGEIHEQTNRM